MNKGGSGIGRGVQDEAWESRFQFDGTKLAQMPISNARTALLPIAVLLDTLAQQRAQCSPKAVLSRVGAGLTSALDEALARDGALFERMVAAQEKLDWAIYDRLGLLTDDERRSLAEARGRCRETEGGDRLAPGHRPFELVLAQSGTASAWCERNGYTRAPLDPEHPLRPLIEARCAVIAGNASVAFIERPEFKRRWGVRDWTTELREASTAVLLDTVEAALARGADARSLRDLERELLKDERTKALLALRFPAEDRPMDRLGELLRDEAIPLLTPLRFTPEGLEKRALWERTWELQRREDAEETLSAPIAVPPKYDREDYSDGRYWSLRGRLDVPRERFIAYSYCTTDDDPSPLYGWAGWNPKQRAEALASLYHRRKNEDGWEPARLAPLLAGLLELVPWLLQWHNAPEAGEDQGAGDAYRAFVDSEARELGWSLDELRAWRPAAKEPARKMAKTRAVKSSAKQSEPSDAEGAGEAAAPEGEKKKRGRKKKE